MSQSAAISDVDWNARGLQGVISIVHIHSSASRAFELFSHCLAKCTGRGILSRVTCRAVALVDSFSTYSTLGCCSTSDRLSACKWTVQYLCGGCEFHFVELSARVHHWISPLVANCGRDRSGYPGRMVFTPGK